MSSWNTKVTSISSNDDDTCSCSGTSTNISTSTLALNTATTTSGSSITLGSGSTYSTLSNGIYFTGDCYSSEGQLKGLISFMTETEIDEMLTKITDRLNNPENMYSLKSIISSMVRSRHFSEAFLMKYLSYISKEDIMTFHAGDVQSGEYSQLGLYLEITK